MQQAISRRDAYEPTLTATIGGREIEASSASMDRDLPDPLTGGALTAASGTIVALEGQDATSTVATPWDPGTQWPPAPEASASVEMGTGSGLVSILRGGRVVSAQGGTGGREVEVEVADQYQSLDRTISWDDLADAMPSTSEGVIARYVSLQSIAYTDRILRHCGWYSTPPKLGFSVLSVPAQGTMWPEQGECVTSIRRSDQAGYPAWGNAPWGVAVSDVDARYVPTGATGSIKSRGHLELTAMTVTAGGGMYLEVQDDQSRALVRLSWTDTTGYLWARDSSGSLQAIAQVPRTDGLLYATVAYASDTSVQVTLRSGGQVTTQTSTVANIVTTQTGQNFAIVGDGRGSGFQAAYPAGAGVLTSWTPNAVIYPRTSNRNTLLVMKSVAGENCADLLREQCEAECATYWIDETGVLRWWDLARLEAQPSVATLTSDDDIDGAGFTWSHSLAQVRSRVAVQWREPAREWAWRTNIDLHQGSGGTLQAQDDAKEAFLNVPDDEVWILPDLSLGRVGSAYSDFNHGIGSWYGAIVDRGDGQDTWAQIHGDLNMTIERVNDATYRTVTSWDGNRPATQRTLDGEAAAGTDLWRRRYDFDLPIIRGKARFTLADQWTYSTQNGPTTAPEHTIDARRWIQRPEQAQYTADYAGGRVTVPQPVLSSIALIPVPGLQLGDVVDVRDTHVTRLTIRGLVVGDSRSIDSDMDMAHAVTVRPLSVLRNGVTWEQWGGVMDERTRTAWGATQTNKQWQQWGATPLAGEDTLNG